VVEGFFLPDWATGFQEFIDTSGRGAFELLENYCKRVRPAFFISQRQQQEMHVVGHHDDCMEVVAFAIVMEAVLEDGVTGLWSKGMRLPLQNVTNKTRPAFW